MIEICTRSITSSIEELLSYATSSYRVAEEYDKYVREESRKLYAMEEHKHFIGCIGIHFTETYCCEIKHIAVSPSKRGQGIGKRMIAFILERHSLQRIAAETDLEAVEFYKSCGFDITSLGEKYAGVERFWCEYNGGGNNDDYRNSGK